MFVVNLPERVNESWSMDFVADQFNNSRRFRVLAEVEDFSRTRVSRFLNLLIKTVVNLKGLLVSMVLNLRLRPFYFEQSDRCKAEFHSNEQAEKTLLSKT